VETPELVMTLTSLVQLELDARAAYSQAIAAADDALRPHLVGLRDEHHQRLTALIQLVRDLGGMPSEPTSDFKGFYSEGFVAAAEVDGPAGALRALRSNERLVGERYEAVRRRDLRPWARGLIARACEEEATHRRRLDELAGA